MSYIENRIQKLLVEAHKLEINVANHKIEWGQWEWQKKDEDRLPPEYLLSGDEELVNPFKHILSSLYLSVLKYLDEKQLHQYLKQFYRIFGKDSNKPVGHDDFELDHYFTGEFYCVFLQNIRQFISAFEFTETNEDRYLRLSGIQYLETVLKNTGMIISNSKETPKSEPNVYKLVKSTMEPIFPNAKYGKSNFKKKARTYIPDILVPELSAAIEYKYADSEKKIVSLIEGILVDVAAYTGDPDYKVFYAVFYVTSDFWGQEKFQSTWNDYKFPSNWIPFYVVGD